MTNYRHMNRLNWNDRTRIHAKSKFYDVEAFVSGDTKLSELDQAELGSVAGRTMLHLQCHFGKDSLAWAQAGAKVTGVDFSEEAITLARSLNEQMGLDARFICSDIYEAHEALQGEQFDIVYTSYGVLCWLSDLNLWAKLIFSSLKEGGTFYIAEFHPIAFIYEVVDNLLLVSTPYFDREVQAYDASTTYTGDDDVLEHSTSYQWQHTLGDIVSALTGAGLTLEFLHEHSYTVYNMFPGHMQQDEQGRWRLQDNNYLPLLFSIKATKT
ncbi:class I SAM-dependent methyltransferase [Paenibacillus daejeonensis]|uniref:class I SAM-dependent methyltransferase n=1 Tax=Paenibacillus daejeonensis TaxID=135193 RepID=UPI0003655D5D|nr:class I SAM-dependent methyltransferase [Paenibacillus daejeonensis]